MLNRKSIGGYFGLELSQGTHFHEDALKFNTARNCLEYILKNRSYQKVYIPYYGCESVLEPFEKLKVEYEFYHIDYNFSPKSHPQLFDDEAFLYTNYFGLNQANVDKLYKIYGKKLIVDNSQAFYALPVDGVDTFYSARKFFGVSDGAYLYTDICSDYESFKHDVSYKRMSHLLVRSDVDAETGYKYFLDNEKNLCNASILKMSNITSSILESVDYAKVKNIRKCNFNILANNLSSTNELQIPLAEDDVPMAYPYLSRNIGLRGRLIDNKIYVAKYWPLIPSICNKDDIEYYLFERLIPLPIDQRYGEQEMLKVINVLRDECIN